MLASMRSQIIVILLLVLVFFAVSEIISQSLTKELKIADIGTSEFILPRSQIVFELTSEFLHNWKQIQSIADYPKSITFIEKTNLEKKIKIILRDFNNVSKSEVLTIVKKKAEENAYKLGTDEEQTIEGRNIHYLLFQNNKQDIQGIYLVSPAKETIAIEFHTTFSKFGDTERPLTMLLKSLTAPKKKLINREIIQLNNNVNLILLKGFNYINQPKNQIFVADNQDVTITSLSLKHFKDLMLASTTIENILVKNKGFQRKSAEKNRIKQNEVIAFH